MSMRSRCRALMTLTFCVTAIAAVWLVPSQARAGHMEFTPGAVYVTIAGGAKGCMNIDPDTIWEYNPATDQWRLFATAPQDMGCTTWYGLAFTPDGSALRVADSLGSRIWEIDADGNMQVVLDADDLVRGPIGSNAIGYDTAGNFYNVNFGGPRGIIQHPAEGGPPLVFADPNDGVHTAGALAFGTDGAVYYAGENHHNEILRFTGAHQGGVFDTIEELDDIESIVADGQGNLYMLGLEYAGPITRARIYRYQVGAPFSRTLLGEVPGGVAQGTLTISPDDRTLYVWRNRSLVLIDLLSMDMQIVPAPRPFKDSGGGWGAAVYVPEPSVAVGLMAGIVWLRVLRGRSRLALERVTKAASVRSAPYAPFGPPHRSVGPPCPTRCDGGRMRRAQRPDATGFDTSF